MARRTFNVMAGLACYGVGLALLLSFGGVAGWTMFAVFAACALGFFVRS